MSEGGNIIRIIGDQSNWTAKENIDLIATEGDITIGSPTKVTIEGIDGGQKFGIYDYIKDPFIGNAFIPIVLIDDSTNNEYEIITQKEQWEVLDKNLDAEYKQPKIKDIKFKTEEKKKVILKFNVKKGNSKANDSDGGNIRVNLYDKEKKLIEKFEVAKSIKYGESFDFEWDKSKNIFQIQFYANDNDYFFDGGIKNVQCGVFKVYEEEVKNKEVCPIDPKYRSHFVIHCTAGEMSEDSIKKHTNYDNEAKRSRSKAHIYVNKNGSQFVVWPFTEKNVWATKIETRKGLKGQMFHVELNYGSPDKPTEKQYQTLADLYIEASNIENCWPIIVPHIEIDRGIPDGHADPTDFDYNYFYSLLKAKGVPIDNIPKFSHDRYWGDKSYRVPWGADKNNWPPILEGNPHK